MREGERSFRPRPTTQAKKVALSAQLRSSTQPPPLSARPSPPAPLARRRPPPQTVSTWILGARSRRRDLTACACVGLVPVSSGPSRNGDQRPPDSVPAHRRRPSRQASHQVLPHLRLRPLGCRNRRRARRRLRLWCVQFALSPAEGGRRARVKE